MWISYSDPLETQSAVWSVLQGLAYEFAVHHSRKSVCNKTGCRHCHARPHWSDKWSQTRSQRNFAIASSYLPVALREQSPTSLPCTTSMVKLTTYIPAAALASLGSQQTLAPVRFPNIKIAFNDSIYSTNIRIRLCLSPSRRGLERTYHILSTILMCSTIYLLLVDANPTLYLDEIHNIEVHISTISWFLYRMATGKEEMSEWEKGSIRRCHRFRDWQICDIVRLPFGCWTTLYKRMLNCKFIMQWPCTANIPKPLIGPCSEVWLRLCVVFVTEPVPPWFQALGQQRSRVCLYV